MTWWSINYDRITIFGWAIPLIAIVFRCMCVCVYRGSERHVSRPVLSLSAKPEQIAGYRPSTFRATAVISRSLTHRRLQTAQSPLAGIRMHIALETGKHFLDLASTKLIGWLHTTSGTKGAYGLFFRYWVNAMIAFCGRTKWICQRICLNFVAYYLGIIYVRWTHS